MTTWVDRVAHALSRTGAASQVPRRGPMIVMYHGLGGSDGIARDSFAAQIGILKARRRIVPLVELVDRLEDPKAVDLAAITFDDGYCDFAEIAVPVLEAAGAHATLFVPAGLVGRSNEWDSGTHATRPILDAQSLRQLDPAHVEIGGHGYSHRRIVALNRESLELETLGCRRELERILERPVRLFAYPYGQRGDFDSAAERAVAEAGFQLACSTCFGRSSRIRHRYRLRRVGIEPGDDLERVAAKLDGAYDWVAWKERLAHGLRSITRGRPGRTKDRK